MEDVEAFPSFLHLPDFNELPRSHYEMHDETIGFLPSRHWCFVAEIIEDQSDLRPRVFVRTRFGEKTLVSFHPECDVEPPQTFKIKDLKVGRTIAIMYAQRKHMLDGSTGIRCERLNHVFVFKASMNTVLRQARFIRSAITSRRRCFFADCVEIPDSLLKCGRCKLALYCGKEHQQLAWPESHKGLCSQMRVLKALLELDMNEWNDFFWFHQVSGSS